MELFREEINKRLDGQSNKKQIDVDKLIKKAENECKEEKIKAGDKKVIIGLFKDKRISAKVTKAEIKYIKEKLKDSEARSCHLYCLFWRKHASLSTAKYLRYARDKGRVTKTHVANLPGSATLNIKTDVAAKPKWRY